MIQKHDSWNTDHEIGFIKNLGTGRNYAYKRKTSLPKSRKALLKLYIESAKVRSNWDGIDRETAIKFAEGCIEHE